MDRIRPQPEELFQRRIQRLDFVEQLSDWFTAFGCVAMADTGLQNLSNGLVDLCFGYSDIDTRLFWRPDSKHGYIGRGWPRAGLALPALRDASQLFRLLLHPARNPGGSGHRTGLMAEKATTWPKKRP